MKGIITLFFAGLVAFSATGQTKSNKQAAAQFNTKGYVGHFNYFPEAKRFINVNYSFTPLVPTETVDFELHTPTPRPLWFQVTDKAGKVVKEWKPEKQVYHYKGTLDVSDLKPGAYTYKIFWDTEEIKSIPFSKK